MATNMQKAKDLLFGKDGLGVSNFRMFPGSNREATAEDIAGEIVRSLEHFASHGIEEASSAD